MIITKRRRIAAGGTIPLYSDTIALKQIFIVVSNAGTSWVGRIEDNASTPAILVPAINLSAPSTLSWIVQHFDEAIPMEKGLDFITVSGTPGVADIWISFEQPTK